MNPHNDEEESILDGPLFRVNSRVQRCAYPLRQYRFLDISIDTIDAFLGLFVYSRLHSDGTFKANVFRIFLRALLSASWEEKMQWMDLQVDRHSARDFVRKFLEVVTNRSGSFGMNYMGEFYVDEGGQDVLCLSYYGPETTSDVVFNEWRHPSTHAYFTE